MKQTLSSELEIPHRKSTRLKDFDYTQAGGYFVTLVTFRREILFGEVVDGEMQVNALGKIVQECWDEIPIHFQNVVTDAFVVMPNHIHGIIFIHGNNSACVGAQHAAPYAGNISPHLRGTTPNVKHGSLGAIVRSFKSAVTHRAGSELNSANIWQRNYYEHILRDQGDYERIAGYIRENPSNWVLDEENLKFSR